MVMMIQLLIGYLGACCFAFCNIPQVIKAFKTKSTKDISFLYIILNIFGNIFSCVYILLNNIQTGIWLIPQYINYSIATISIIVLLYTKNK